MKQYKKIDIFNSKYQYICTTTWAKNLKQALLRYPLPTFNSVDNTIYAKYQDGKNFYKLDRKYKLC